MEPWLYIVLLGLVLVVYAKFVPKREQPSKQTNVIKEIEDTMEQFSAELEEENRQFLGLVSDMKKEHDIHTSKLQGRIEALEQQNRAVNDQLSLLIRAEQKRRDDLPSLKEESLRQPILSASRSIVQEMVELNDAERDKLSSSLPADSHSSQPERGPMNIRERYANVFHLYDQGKSTEYIAKKLEMNKGEVMLIIQLAKQEDQARV
ncbi:hypothetical protein FE784_21260 [Paenibacillus hemerocallicola]|uniref:DUF2802 domain-containing protein n=1 Tax=Paenibacillus hemerocallicola TaxID=1172614 RepID=A0A5C4T5H7_9BACL|nr:hypothetical protein [Paenibacillus hemerocallicola]TNJ64321.1 hypothetical protein FE784_21260 [Paenibacillus hemerocallicola]